MQLKTVEERGREQHIHWLKMSATAQLKAIGEMTVLPYGYLETAIKETLTQDRADIRAVLTESIKGLEVPNVGRENKPTHHKTAYNRGLKDARLLIEKLLNDIQ